MIVGGVAVVVAVDVTQKKNNNFDTVLLTRLCRPLGQQLHQSLPAGRRGFIQKYVTGVVAVVLVVVVVVVVCCCCCCC